MGEVPEKAITPEITENGKKAKRMVTWKDEHGRFLTNGPGFGRSKGALNKVTRNAVKVINSICDELSKRDLTKIPTAQLLKHCVDASVAVIRRNDESRPGAGERVNIFINRPSGEIIEIKAENSDEKK